MDGLECSEVDLSELEDSFRIDPEFFRKKYTFYAKWVKSVNHSSLLRETTITCKGIFNINASLYSDIGIPFVRISNLKNMLIDGEDIVYIPQSIDELYPNTHLYFGDVILSKTAIPAASFVNLSECNVSQDTVAIRLKKTSKLRSAFLTAFLNTKYGIAAMERRFTGNIQMHLNLIECKEKLLIPILGNTLQTKVETLFLQSISFLRNSQAVYHEAESLFFSTFPLDTFTLSTKNTSTKSFSQIAESGRLDAEYYHPKYDELLQCLKEHTDQIITVKNIRIVNHRGVQPDYMENGEIAVVNSKNILENGLDYDGFSATSHTLWALKPDAHIKKDDILIYTTGANIGRTAIYRRTEPALASNHVNILRVKYNHPQYIAFVLNSMIGRLQTERISTGSAQQELYPKDIDSFIIPLVPEATQIEIENLLDKSFAMREQSKSLLKAAVRAVEIAIEQGEATAIAYLQEQTEGDL